MGAKKGKGLKSHETQKHSPAMMTAPHHQLELDPTQMTARPHVIRDIERVHVVLL